MIDPQREREEHVRQAVEVYNSALPDLADNLALSSPNDQAFSTSAHRSGDVKLSGSRMPTRKHKRFERRQTLVAGVDPGFELLDLRIGHAWDNRLGRVGRGEIGTQNEQIVLHLAENGVRQVDTVGGQQGAHHSDDRVRFVDGAIGFYAWVIFGDAGTAEEARRTAVSRPRVDFQDVEL